MRLSAAYPKELTMEGRIAARKGRVYLETVAEGIEIDASLGADDGRPNRGAKGTRLSRSLPQRFRPDGRLALLRPPRPRSTRLDPARLEGGYAFLETGRLQPRQLREAPGQARSLGGFLRIPAVPRPVPEGPQAPLKRGLKPEGEIPQYMNALSTPPSRPLSPLDPGNFSRGVVKAGQSRGGDHGRRWRSRRCFLRFDTGPGSCRRAALGSRGRAVLAPGDHSRGTRRVCQWFGIFDQREHRRLEASPAR